MALKGIRVIELAGLAPVPFCGMILADFGAKVIRVDKANSAHVVPDTLARGKQSIAINLKHPDGINVMKQLCDSADILIEPFRAGVMEKLGLGPDVLLSHNPALIYARLTGYGQLGPMAHNAGHDINYIATAGVLSTLGRKNDKPMFPVNMLADFAGGGLTCALGILMALFERSRSGQGQVIDANMVQGSAYLASFLWSTKNANLPIWGRPRGENLLDSGSYFYDTYRTADNKYMAVGSLEPKFYNNLLIGLGLDPGEFHQLSDQEEMKERLTQIFSTKTRDEWTEIFSGVDECVTPILEMDEAPNLPHNLANNTFLRTASGHMEPGPAPFLHRTPAVSQALPLPAIGQHTREIMNEIGYSGIDIDRLVASGVIEEDFPSSKL